MKKILGLAMLVPLLGLPLWAQEESEQKKPEAVQEESEQKARETAQEEGEGKIRKMVKEGDSPESKYVEKDEEGKLLRAIRLPEAAEEARREGVPEEDVKKVLEAARRRDLPAGETETIMAEETKAVRERGQIDNFGSFVQEKLDEGLRGRELSEAIRAEHAARGKGKGHGKGGKAGVSRVEENDRDEPGAKSGKHGGKKSRAEQGDRKDGGKGQLVEEIKEGEEDIREKPRAEKKWKKGKKKGKEELPPEKERS